MLVEDGPGWSGRENLSTLERNGLPLGVECSQCQHRALVPFHVLRRRGHDMTPIKRLPLVSLQPVVKLGRQFIDSII
jgi:hypothetical protein